MEAMKMTKHTLEVEAESLDEAWAQISLQVPSGYSVLSENIISDGSPNTVMAVADSIDEALEKAMDKVPDGAKVLSQKEVALPEQVTVSVEAYDKAEAKRKLKEQKGESAVVRGLRLMAPGKKGFLGIGRRPNQYALDVSIPACVEIEYQGKVKISVTLTFTLYTPGGGFSPHSWITSLSTWR
jgi:hypothetical protein